MRQNSVARTVAVGVIGFIAAVALFAFLSPSVRINFGSRAWAQSGAPVNWGGASTGSANAYAVTIPNYSAYTVGSKIAFLANFANTGASTITVSWQGGALSSENIDKLGSGGPQALQGGEIQVGYAEAVWDGTEFILLSNQSGGIIAGMVFNWTGPIAPAGFLTAGGQAVSRTTYNVLFDNTTVQQNGTLTNASEIVTGLSSTSNLEVGYPVCGTDINSGTTVGSIDSGTQIHLSANATGNGTYALTFAPNGCGDGSTTFNVFDGRGLATIGKDDEGGTPANRITTAGSGLNGVQIGAIGGAQNQTLAQSVLPNVTLAVAGVIPAPGTGSPNSFVVNQGGVAGFSLSGSGNIGVTGSNGILTSGTTASINGGVTQTPTTTLGPAGIVWKIVKY